MKTPYIEQDCIFEHEGHKYEAGGAYITDEFVIGYMNSDMTKINTWHGELITDNVKITSSWRMPWNCWISERQYQIKALINGKWFTGRTMGGQMIVKMRLCASERK